MQNVYLEDLISKIKDVSQKVRDEFALLDSEQLNRKVNPNNWSIGQCLDHIMTTNATYFAQFDALIAGTKKNTFFEKVPVLPRIMGKMLIKLTHPDTSQKSKTVPAFEPTQSDIGISIIPDFLKHQDILKDYMQKTDHVGDHQKVIVTSGGAKFVTYSLKDCFTILAGHEERHYQQALRVRNNFLE